MKTMIHPAIALVLGGLLITESVASFAQPATPTSPLAAQPSAPPAAASGEAKQGANMMQQGGMECPIMKQSAQMAENMQQMQKQMAEMMTMMQKIQAQGHGR